MKRHSQRCYAFTLIELLVVIAIIAFAASLWNSDPDTNPQNFQKIVGTLTT